MLFKVFGPRAGQASADARPGATSAAARFPDLMTALLNQQLHELPDPAIRFALQSRIDTGASLADTVRSLALLEVFFDLERLDVQLSTDAVAQLDEASHPAIALLKQPPRV